MVKYTPPSNKKESGGMKTIIQLAARQKTLLFISMNDFSQEGKRIVECW